MNLNQLRFARAVAQTGSFSRAADACCVTQPTLSNAVGQLENELGGRLFRRTTRSVALTAFGRHLLPLIEAVLDAQRELLGAARAYQQPAHQLLRIGLSPLVDMRLFDRILAPFTTTRPQLEVFFKQCFLDDMEERLDHGTVDVAIVPRVLPRVGRECCGLYDEPLYFLPRAADGTAPLPSGPCRLADHAGEPVILTRGCGLAEAIAELYQSEGLTLTPYPGQALSYQVVEDWAGLGIGAGILPRSKVSPGNQGARPIVHADGRPARVAFEAQWLAEATGVAQVAELVGYLREGRESVELAGPLPSEHPVGEGDAAGAQPVVRAPLP